MKTILVAAVPALLSAPAWAETAPAERSIDGIISLKTLRPDAPRQSRPPATSGARAAQRDHDVRNDSATEEIWVDPCGGPVVLRRPPMS
ncbi:hypothetical protein [Rhodosalinus halophilus]|uniref:hypothetical protein n=1 Tax=Rhodosalinus halophilus TaxID=2259333 RepID=UPI001F43B409|nr:hypothetical protein [Rhodosalinus halophilus]